MENAHPNAEQLSCYMESPEANGHKDIRNHLMTCDSCRNRIDKLAQLELDIKHYAPRFAPQSPLHDDNDQLIERYVDGQLDKPQHQQVAQTLTTDENALKSALHYAVHATAMSKNVEALPITVAHELSQQNHPVGGRFGGLLQRFAQSLRWQTPAWAMVPASLAIAAVISYAMVTNLEGQQQDSPTITAFQDNAIITYKKPGMPAGSIGFFHDAQSHSEPFSGINVAAGKNRQLIFSWQPIANASEYTIEVYIYKQGEKQLLGQQSSTTTHASLQNIVLSDGRHYEWQLSGETHDGLKFQTKGDFIFTTKRR